MVFDHLHWPEILADIQQRYPYIKKTERVAHIEDQNGGSNVPYLRCDLFDLDTGLCTNHNDQRPNFCLNTGENNFFSSECLRRHHPDKKPKKIFSLFKHL